MTSFNKCISYFVLIGCVLLLFSACNQERLTIGYRPTPIGNQPLVNMPTATESASSQPINVLLKSYPTGMMTMLWSAKTRVLLVQTKFYGLAPKSVYTTHIYSGACQHGGSLLYRLPSVVVDNTGAATGTARITLLRGIPTRGWYVAVHPSPQAASQVAPLSCADIVYEKSLASWQSQSATARFKNLASSTEDGRAQLSLSGGKLIVKTTMHHLLPHATYRGRIWPDPCSADPGKALYELEPIVADSTGNGSATTEIPSITQIPYLGWSINYMLETRNNPQSRASHPGSCGNVEL